MAVVIDGFTIDAATSEETRFSSEISEFPVEEGIGVTDNVRNLPIELTIEGVVSNTPLRPLSDVRSILTPPAEEFLAHMELIHQFREPVTVETDTRAYGDMVLQDFNIPRDARTGDALVFRATFRQIDIVTNDRKEILVDLPRAKPLKSFGARAPKVAGSDVPSLPPGLGTLNLII